MSESTKPSVVEVIDNTVKKEDTELQRDLLSGLTEPQDVRCRRRSIVEMSDADFEVKPNPCNIPPNEILHDSLESEQIVEKKTYNGNDNEDNSASDVHCQTKTQTLESDSKPVEGTRSLASNVDQITIKVTNYDLDQLETTQENDISNSKTQSKLKNFFCFLRKENKEDKTEKRKIDMGSVKNKTENFSQQNGQSSESSYSFPKQKLIIFILVGVLIFPTMILLWNYLV